MSNSRKNLTSEYVHVTQRGLGRRIIFEDDRDKRRFLAILESKLADSKARILAWCLMDNHFHLLVNASAEELSRLMQRTSISYAQYFNGRHGHVGKVFQRRFSSVPVESDAHLLAVVRYIHRNAEDAGAELSRYPWSSYRDIVGAKDAEGRGICDTKGTVSLFGSLDECVSFHEEANVEDELLRIAPRPRLSDGDAKAVIVHQLGENYADRVSSLPKSDRDRALRLLKDLGLSVRQIERLTGIGRSIIARA